MPFNECIDAALAEGVITEEQAARVRRLATAFENEPKPGSAAYVALEREVEQRVRRLNLQHQAQKRAFDDLSRFEGDDIGEALIALLERDGSGRAPYTNVVARQNAMRGMAHAMMETTISNLRKTAVLGRVSRRAAVSAMDMVREVFGESSGNAFAKDMAKGWTEAEEFLRKEFNSLGGDIPERNDWGMPQMHDSAAVREAGFAEWYSFIHPRLARNKMKDYETGEPLTAERLEEILVEVWETIATEGFSKVKETAVAGPGRSLARRRQDSRFFHFRGAQEWMEYSERFGSGEPFSIMMNYVDSMSRDIALLSVLGPNPNTTVQFLKTQAQKAAAEADAAAGTGKRMAKLRASLATFDDMYNLITGTSHMPVNETVARSFAGLGNLLTAAYLGSTSILAVMTDPNFTRITKRMAGMDVFQSSFKQAFRMLTASKATKSQVIRQGLIAENWSSIAYGQARYARDVLGGKMSEAISHAAMNISLLSPFTQAGRWAFGMEFMGFIADNTKKSYKSLNPDFRETLTRYGISDVDWADLRKYRQYEFKGAKFLRPDEIFEENRDLAFKVLEMVQGMTNLAVPVASTRGRAALVGGTRPGTVTGEIARSFAMFKNFPVTVYLNHIRAALHQPSMGRKLSIAGDLLITSTAMAALAIQLREITKGRDPVAMDTSEFWGKALLTGGGLGIYGDFLFNDVNRFGGGLTETIAGPRIQFLNDLRRLTLGNAMEVARREKTNAALETVDFFGRHVPGASTWYLRLAIERGILDRLRLMADPNARKRFRNMERRYLKDYNQEHWWRPGVLVPERAPDISAALGEQ